MGDVPPQEGEGVGRVRKIKHLMISRGLYPSLPMKKTAEANLVISVVFFGIFGCFGALRGAPGVTDG